MQMHHMLAMSYLIVLLVTVAHAAVLISPLTSIQPAVSLMTTTKQLTLKTVPTSVSEAMTKAPISSLTTFSPLVTIAPLSRNPLELRQKCFNDQGFSVNCATWTGYYYTWGGAGHPYAGGPGDSGSGSGNGNGNTNGITGIISGANRMQILVTTTVVAFVAVCILMIV